MSPHPGYGMTAAVTAGDYVTNPYAAPPYSTGGYTCAPTGYPVTTGYPVPPGGYSPGAACYSMPPPQHSLGQHDKSPNKDRSVFFTATFFWYIHTVSMLLCGGSY